jgi:hypothetical protein
MCPHPHMAGTRGLPRWGAVIYPRGAGRFAFSVCVLSVRWTVHAAGTPDPHPGGGREAPGPPRRNADNLTRNRNGDSRHSSLVCVTPARHLPPHPRGLVQRRSDSSPRGRRARIFAEGRLDGDHLRLLGTTSRAPGGQSKLEVDRYTDSWCARYASYALPSHPFSRHGTHTLTRGAFCGAPIKSGGGNPQPHLTTVMHPTSHRALRAHAHVAPAFTTVCELLALTAPVKPRPDADSHERVRSAP